MPLPHRPDRTHDPDVPQGSDVDSTTNQPGTSYFPPDQVRAIQEYLKRAMGNQPVRTTFVPLPDKIAKNVKKLAAELRDVRGPGMRDPHTGITPPPLPNPPEVIKEILERNVISFGELTPVVIERLSTLNIRLMAYVTGYPLRHLGEVSRALPTQELKNIFHLQVFCLLVQYIKIFREAQIAKDSRPDLALYQRYRRADALARGVVLIESPNEGLPIPITRGDGSFFLTHGKTISSLPPEVQKAVVLLNSFAEDV